MNELEQWRHAIATQNDDPVSINFAPSSDAGCKLVVFDAPRRQTWLLLVLWLSLSALPLGL